jgi:hypothetical protein
MVALVLVAAALVVLVLIALAAPAARNDGPPLDPDSTAPNGTKAAIELARELGADVRVTSDFPGDDVDVAMMFEDLTQDAVAPRLQRWMASGHTLVVAAPISDLTPRAEGQEPDSFRESTTVERGRCDVREPAGLPALGSLEAFGPVARYAVPDEARACFVDDNGAFVVVQAVGQGLLVSVGSPWVFTNEALDQADNAGLFAALAVPDSGTRLDVLVAGSVDGELQAPSDDSLRLPTGVSLALLQLLIAFVVYTLYRARRLGKPVAEDQQVVIAGSELVRAVGGLLEHAGARDRAATSLRRSARRRLASAFGLPAGASSDQVVGAVSSRTPLPHDRLAAALVDVPVVDDASLARLARELDEIVAAAVGRTEPTPKPSDTPGDAP